MDTFDDVLRQIRDTANRYLGETPAPTPAPAPTPVVDNSLLFFVLVGVVVYALTK